MFKKSYKNSKEAKIKKEIDKIVQMFVVCGFSQSELERCLDLCQGALKTDSSPELLALLKILKNFPWMIRVAEKDFDILESKKALCHAAIDLMFQQSDKEGPRVKQK